jgi:predicted DNA-binding transcriptional regulator YafY
MGGQDDPLVTISELAMQSRLARISYRKLGVKAWTVRLVEPYALVGCVGDEAVVRCWQVDPPVDDNNGWRSFRLDRILSASDGGAAFVPRCRVALGGTFIHEYQTALAEPEDRDPETAYRHYLQLKRWPRGCLLSR